MECINCECTVKAMNEMDASIRMLLQRSQRVNGMMEGSETMIKRTVHRRQITAAKAPMVQQANIPEKKASLAKLEWKKSVQAAADDSTMDSSATASGKGKSYVYNKYLGRAESVDFHVAEVPTFESSTRSTSPSTNPSPSCKATVCPIVRSENASVTTYTTSDTLKTNMTPSTASPSSITTPVKSAPFSSAVVLNEKWIVEENGEKKVLPMKVYVKQRHHDGSLDLLLVYLDEHREKVMELAMNLNGDKVTNVQFCGEKMQIEKN